MEKDKNVVVEFSMYPVGNVHFSDKISKVVKVLDHCGLEYQVGPMSTSLRGDWSSVMAVIRDCHDTLAKDCERVITTLTIDDRKGEEHGLKERVEIVEHRSAG